MIKEFIFVPEKNKYVLRIDDKTYELSREEAVCLYNTMNKVLKATPPLFATK
jgi:hypothetical protein